MRRASIVLPEPGAPIINTLCPPAAAISSARFTAVLSFHVGEILGIGTLRRQSCLGIHRHRRIESPLPLSRSIAPLAQGVQTVHFDPLDDRRFSGVSAGTTSRRNPSSRALTARGSTPRTG